MLRKIIVCLLIIFSYCLLAGIFTYPLILNLDSNLVDSKIPFFVSLYVLWPKIDIFSANIIWLACLVIGAYLAYLTAESQLKNKMLAWGAGILFAFSFYNLNSWDSAKEIILKLVILPLYILLWLKYFEKKKEAYYYLLLFLLIIFSYAQYASALCAFFIGIILLFINKNKINIKRKIVELLIVFLLTSLFFFINNINAYKINERFRVGEQINNSITIAELFTPFHKFNDTNHLAYIGIIATVLIIFSFRKKREKEWQLWLYLTLLFFILSLGPFLRYINLIDPHFPLPYLFIFQYFPFSALLTKPYNFFIVAQLGLSILAMYGFSTFWKKNTTSIYQYFIFICCLIIISWEISSLPQTVNNLKISSYYPTISNSFNKKNVLEISDENKLQIWKTKYAEKKYDVTILNNANTDTTQPILSELFLNGEKRSIIKHDYGLIGPSILGAYNIEYVNFAKDYSNNYYNGEKFLKKYFAPVLVFENEEEKIYKISTTNNKKTYLQIEPARWSYLKKTKNKIYRDAKNDASIIIYNFNQKYQNVAISLNMSSEIEQELKIYLDDEVLEQQNINPETKIININLHNLSPGEHYLRFHLNKKMRVYSIEY